MEMLAAEVRRAFWLMIGIGLGTALPFMML